MSARTLDAGDLGCGDGLAAWFVAQLAEAAAGEQLRIVARDPAAYVELPALARLRGHTVLSIRSVDNCTTITVRREQS